MAQKVKQLSRAIGECLRELEAGMREINVTGADFPAVLSAALALDDVLVRNGASLSDLAAWIAAWSDFELALEDCAPRAARSLFHRAMDCQSAHDGAILDIAPEPGDIDATAETITSP